MKKYGGKIALILMSVVLVIALTACSPYRQKAISGGQPDKPVYGNGSLVVRQGDYIYFVNGMTSVGADNTFKRNTKYKGEDNVLKGCVMRAKISADGTVDKATQVTVIPQALFTSYEKGGLYIFGEWIYYVTPNTAKSKSGDILSGQTLIMRTKIDGTGTQKIATVKEPGDTGLRYKVTKDYILYMEGTALKAIDLNKKNFSVSNVAEDVVDFIVPSVPYETAAGDAFFDYVIYTQYSGEKQTSSSHTEVKASNGKNTVVLIADNAYFDEDKKGDWLNSANLERIYSYTPVSASYEKDDNGVYGLAVYANRSQFKAQKETKEGLFGYFFGSNLAFSKSRVIEYAVSDQTTFLTLGFSAGILVGESDAVRYYAGMAEEQIEAELNGASGSARKNIVAEILPKGVKVFGGSSLHLVRASKTAQDGIYDLYFTTAKDSGAFQTAQIDLKWPSKLPGGSGADYDESKFTPFANVKILITSDVVGKWFAPVFVTYGNTAYFYFIYAYNYDYLHRIPLKENAPAISDDNSIEMIGAFTKADREAYEEREKAEK